MEQWVLNCRECNQDFAYTQDKLTKTRAADDAFGWLGLEPKPDFPPDGLNLECPNCGTTSLYQRHQFLFRHDRI